MHSIFSSRTKIALTAAAVFIVGCSKENDGTPTGQGKTDIHYAISNVSGAFPNQTTYLQGTADLSMTTLDNSKAIESSSFSSQWSYNGAVYLTAFAAPATVNRYTFDASGKAVISGTLIVPGANTFSSIEFVSDSVAYASVGGGLARVIKFDPTAMRTTGEVDLTPVLKTGATSTYYLGMKSRDGKLFLGIQYFDASFDYLADSAFVAVIDMPSNKIDKLLSDGRTSNIFLAGSSVSGFALDNNGDLYIQGQGSGAAPSGILRIKKGATDFDKSYFFDLKAATGKDCAALYIPLSGYAFTTQLQDASDAYESKGPQFRYYRIDLAAQKSLGELSSGLPNIYGSSTSIMRSFDGKTVTFVVSSKTENSIYNYDPATGAVTKKVALSSGVCTGLDKIN